MPAPLSARIRVERAQTIGEVNPQLFGHFIEHLEDCIYHGMWSELLRNRKFAGHDMVYYGVVNSWKPIGASPARVRRRARRGEDESAHQVDAVAYNHDNSEYYVAGLYGRGQSQRIEIRRPTEQPCGIGQSGIGLLAGRRYDGSVVVRGEGITECTISLAGQTHEISGIDRQWRRYPFSFTAPSTQPDALFSVTTRQQGRLWIGCASLMPSDNESGWRRDVSALVRALKPPIIRYPGGNFASAYHWRDGIGEQDRRPVCLDRAWLTFEPNDVGTDEFMALCQTTGAEPYLCTNMGDGTPEEAAAWVEYCNGPATSTYGSLRVANGHPEPYNVIYWGLGNEVYGNWQVGHVDAETYARDCVRWAAAMRAADPAGDRLKLLAVGATPDFWPEWNDAVASIAGSAIDYITLHHYAQADEEVTQDEEYLMTVTAPARIADLIAASCVSIDRAAPAGKHIAISFDEWNVAHRRQRPGAASFNGDWPALEQQAVLATTLDQVGSPHQDYALADGLYAASFFNVMLRRADRVTMATQAQLVNLFGLIETSETDAYGTGEYHAYRLYVDHHGDIAVRAESESPVFDVPATGNMPARCDEPYLDVAATRDKGGRTVWLHVVNRHPYEPIMARIECGAPIVAATHHMLSGSGPWVRNSFADKDALHVESTPVHLGEPFEIAFPPCSASSVQLTLE